MDEPAKSGLENQTLTNAEREAALGAMSPADWARANSLARAAVYGLEMAPEELLHEAIVALLSGDRTWRRGIPPLVTLKVAMSSIASNERKKIRNAPIDRFAEVLTDADDVEDGKSPPVVGRHEITPERLAEAKDQLASISKTVEGDDHAELVVTGLAMGFSGKEAIAETELTENEYKAARKRFLRKLHSTDRPEEN